MALLQAQGLGAAVRGHSMQNALGHVASNTVCQKKKKKNTRRTHAKDAALIKKMMDCGSYGRSKPIGLQLSGIHIM